MVSRRRNSKFYPQQFRTFDLLALTTVVGLAAAMAVPWLRGLDSGLRSRMLIVAGFQVLVLTAAIMHYARRRQRLLERSGEWLGAGVCGRSRFVYLRVAKAVLYSAALIGFQVLVAIQIAYDLKHYGTINGIVSRWFDAFPVSQDVLGFLQYFEFLDLLYYAQLSWSAGLVASMCRWRIYPNTVEFFQHGIVKQGIMMIPIDRVEFRQSARFDNCLAVLMRATPTSTAASTVTVQVTDEVRAKLLQS